MDLRLGGVLITKVVPDGLVDRWNAENFEEVGGGVGLEFQGGLGFMFGTLGPEGS